MQWLHRKFLLSTTTSLSVSISLRQFIPIPFFIGTQPATASSNGFSLCAESRRISPSGANDQPHKPWGSRQIQPGLRSDGKEIFTHEPMHLFYGTPLQYPGRLSFFDSKHHLRHQRGVTDFTHLLIYTFTEHSLNIHLGQWTMHVYFLPPSACLRLLRANKKGALRDPVKVSRSVKVKGDWIRSDRSQTRRTTDETWSFLLFFLFFFSSHEGETEWKTLCLKPANYRHLTRRAGRCLIVRVFLLFFFFPLVCS
jgi:hypothetical protein